MLTCHLLEDAGARRGRRDAVDGDVVAGQFLAERLGQRDDAGLGGRIGGRVRVAFLAGDRGDVDDAAVTARLHAGGDRAVGVERAVEVDVDHPAPLLHRIGVHREVLARDAGAVDQDGNGAQFGLGLGDGALGVLRPRDVHADGQRLVDVPDGHMRAGRWRGRGDGSDLARCVHGGSFNASDGGLRLAAADSTERSLAGKARCRCPRRPTPWRWQISGPERLLLVEPVVGQAPGDGEADALGAAVHVTPSAGHLDQDWRSMPACRCRLPSIRSDAFSGSLSRCPSGEADIRGRRPANRIASCSRPARRR
jgi:hypothetical protein